MALVESDGHKKYACKFARRKSFNKEAERESKNLQLLNKLDLLHTVAYVSFTILKFTRTQKRALLVQEYGGKNLYSYICDTSYVSIEHIAHIAAQALMFWQVLHREKLVYRDIKPENMLIQGDPMEPGSIKFIDPACLGKEGKRANYYESTRFYRSPDVLFETYKPSETPFALACVLFEIATNTPRFSTKKRDEPKASRMQRHLSCIQRTYKAPTQEWISHLPEHRRNCLFSCSSEGFFQLKNEFSSDPYIERYSNTTTESRLEEARTSRLLIGLEDGLTIIPEFASLIDTLLDYERPSTPDRIMEKPFFQTFRQALAVHQAAQEALARR